MGGRESVISLKLNSWQPATQVMSLQELFILDIKNIITRVYFINTVNIPHFWQRIVTFGGDFFSLGFQPLWFLLVPLGKSLGFFSWCSSGTSLTTVECKETRTSVFVDI